MQTRRQDRLEDIERRVFSCNRIIDVGFLVGVCILGLGGGRAWVLDEDVDSLVFVLLTFTKVCGACACARGALAGWRAYQWDKLGFWDCDVDRAALMGTLCELRSCALLAFSGFVSWGIAAKLLA